MECGSPVSDIVYAWFPEDLIEKYGGSAGLTGPTYDQLYFPNGVADDIAEELRDLLTDTPTAAQRLSKLMP